MWSDFGEGNVIRQTNHKDIINQDQYTTKEIFNMGENYTRKTINYEARQERQKNTSSAPQVRTVLFTCWRCEKGFELPILTAKPDHVWCPHCKMIHGQITHSKDL